MNDRETITKAYKEWYIKKEYHDHLIEWYDIIDSLQSKTEM